MTDEIAKPEALDISSEEYRIYTYASGATFRVNEPSQLYVMPNGSHRVVDRAGLTHRPSPNWTGLSWKPREGKPAFVA